MNVRQSRRGDNTVDDNTETDRGCRREDDRRGAESEKVALPTHGRRCAVALVAAVEDGEQRSRLLRERATRDDKHPDRHRDDTRQLAQYCHDMPPCKLWPYWFIEYHRAAFAAIKS